MKTGYVFHPDYLMHKNPSGYHPERPERLQAIKDNIEKSNLINELKVIQPEEIDQELLTHIHTQNYINNLKETAKNSDKHLDPDTYTNQNSWGVALLAAGGVIKAAEYVYENKVDNAFCAIRPPGHHAESNRAMGFCLINNVAMAARFLQAKYNIEKIAIIDWDVHHGNGTQEIFYEDNTVFYISIHQYPFFPGTGASSETGRGKGTGYTLNIPVEAGSNEKHYISAFDDEIVPAIEKFAPEFIIISAGFDAHKNDPLGGINLTDESFGLFTSKIKDVAAHFCDNKILSVLEGGYDLEGLAGSVHHHVNQLLK